MTDFIPPPSLGYIGVAHDLQPRHCREQAACFRWLAQREMLAQMRRHLTHLAREYEDLAVARELHAPAENARAGVSANDNRPIAWRPLYAF